MGGAKALLRHPDGTPWVARAAQVLAEGGCDPVVVVLGAAAGEAEALVPAGAGVVVAADWAEGMGASLRAGLTALAAPAERPARADGQAGAVLVGLVDTPGVTAGVVARLLAVAAPSVLARASYGGSPGHPVLIGREHWSGVVDTARGDAGARGYLAGRQVTLVECGDIGDGRDLDRPADR